MSEDERETWTGYTITAEGPQWEQYKCAHVAIKIFFEKHQQLMEEHTYGNLEFGSDEYDPGYAAPKPKRKVSAMVDDIESTLKHLTEGTITDSTPVLVPQSLAPVAQAPPPQKPAPVKAQASRPPSLAKLDVARKPSTDTPPATATTPLSPVKQSVFAIEKIEHIPVAKGNPPHNPVLASIAQKHDISLNKQQQQFSESNKGIETKRPSIKAKKAMFEANNNEPVKSQAPTREKPVLQRIESKKQSDYKKFETVISIGGGSGTKPDASRSVSNPTPGSASVGQQPQFSESNKGIETKRPSIKAKKAMFEANNNEPVKSQPPAREKPVLQRIESKQSDYKKFETWISIGGGSGTKPEASRTVSNPTQGSAPLGQQPIQKSKTMPTNKGIPAFYEAPQSSVPPSTPIMPADNVYLFASEPTSDHYSSLSTYSSVGGAGQAVVTPVVYNRVKDPGPGMGQGGGAGGDVYAQVSKAQVQQKPASQPDSGMYESVAVGNVKSPPPIPDRNYVEDEKSPATEKPGSGASDVNTSGIPGFKTRLGETPKGPKQKPMQWAATTKM